MNSEAIKKQFDSSSNKSWCPVPWLSASTTTNGHYRLCVQANSDRESRGLYYSDKGTALTAKAHSVQEVRNSELAKEVRLAMLKGEMHPSCVRCKSEEDGGLVSRRVLSRAKYVDWERKISLEKCQQKTSPTGSIEPKDFDIIELDVRMGNRCNLACRSCYPGESSGWYKEWFKTKSKRFQSGDHKVSLQETAGGQVRVVGSDPDWTQGSALLTNLYRDAPRFEFIHIVGGEPLLIEEHFKTLESFIHSGQSKKITLDYNSNITVIPKRALELWQSFKQVCIGYSIDGVGEVNNYIRYPSKWSSLESNLRLLDQSSINLKIWPTVTVMAYNALYLPEIVRWQIESNFSLQNHEEMITFFVPHFLRNPAELSLQVLPRSVKQEIEKKYLEFQSGWFADHLSELKDRTLRELWKKRLDYIFSSVVSFMYESDESQHFDEFCRRTKTMDQYRNQSFQQSLPELHGLLQRVQD
jgi:sulfatase maturation enzyme AslB (radical SAM superfamily)